MRKFVNFAFVVMFFVSCSVDGNDQDKPYLSVTPNNIAVINFGANSTIASKTGSRIPAAIIRVFIFIRLQTVCYDGKIVQLPRQDRWEKSQAKAHPCIQTLNMHTAREGSWKFFFLRLDEE